MSLFELQRNYHILTYILSLFTSPPIFLSASHVLSAARPRYHARSRERALYAKKYARDGRGAVSFITRAKSPEEAVMRLRLN